jgi:rifampicin phosphotransferase
VTSSTSDPAPPPEAEFPITWQEPWDPELTWTWDDMHMPSALAPLAGDYVHTIGSGFAYGYRSIGLPLEMRTRIWNGYAYFAWRTDAPLSAGVDPWDGFADACRARIPTSDAYWHERVPELRDIYAGIAAQPVETMSATKLAELWDEAWEGIGRAWSIHFLAIRGPYQVLEDLADLYESIVADPPPGEGLALIGGGVHELHDVERTLEELAAMAAASPTLAARLAEPDVTMADVAATPGSTGFVEALEAFLAEHGHLGQGFDDLAFADWAERPELVLGDIAKRLEHPPAIDAETRRERLAAKAEELADGVRGRLAGDPEGLQRFETLLAAARQIGPLTETHNYWIDRMAQSSLRRFVLRCGRRLASIDVIDDPEDILFFRRDEVPPLLRVPEDRRAIVEERRETLARWRTVRPPSVVGKPAEPDDGEVDRFDGRRIESTVPDALRGTGASAGVVRGRARIVRTQADFASVGSGDIIVCPSSNPSWVPLFAIAGGLITDTGGVLSHAAVVAREFALPAVVGVGQATTRIAADQLVEIDGTSGIVRLL